MDLDDFNASLQSLENRFSQLRQTEQRRSLVADKALTDLKAQLEAESETLSRAIAERDALFKEKEEGQEFAKELEKQLSDRAAERTAAEERVKALEDQLVGAIQERDIQAKEKEKMQIKVVELNKQLEHSSELLTEKQSKSEAATEEAELTLLQLDQVQEELQHYFYKSRAKDEFIQLYQIQQQRIKKIIARLLEKL